jgi:rhamnulokinase
VIAGVLEDGRVRLDELHRFDNGARLHEGHLRWDIDALYGEVLVGLRRVAEAHPRVESIGIDTWAVDYALLDGSGNLLGDPIAYRDDRTLAAVDQVHRVVPPGELYAVNGLQHLPFNTIFQLAAERRSDRWADAAHVVLLPDLLAYWLTGELATEETNASTTGLLDVHTRRWSGELLARCGIPPGMLPPLQAPGSIRGAVHHDLCETLGLRPGTVVTTVASHDTASAVVAVPAATTAFAYIASGTWSLVGLELDRPVVDGESRAANFTNEAGLDGRIRFLRNTGGLWLLQEAMRAWRSDGHAVDLDSLLHGAGAVYGEVPLIDVDDQRFIAPGEMPERIAVAAGDSSLAGDPPRLVRCVVESLAAAYAATVDDAERLSRREVEVVHVVGGGSRNELLCQRTADRCGLPVTAGPVEATALGNVLVQARALGAAPGSLEELRRMVLDSVEVLTYAPQAALR